VEPDRLGEPRLGLAVEIPVDAQVPSLRLSAAALADQEIELAVPVEIADPGERVVVAEIELAVVVLAMGTPPTETTTGAAKSAASPAAAGTRSPNPTQLAAAASASRTRIGILPFSRPASTSAQRRKVTRMIWLQWPGRRERCTCAAPLPV